MAKQNGIKPVVTMGQLAMVVFDLLADVMVYHKGPASTHGAFESATCGMCLDIRTAKLYLSRYEKMKRRKK